MLNDQQMLDTNDLSSNKLHKYLFRSITESNGIIAISDSVKPNENI